MHEVYSINNMHMTSK